MKRKKLEEIPDRFACLDFETANYDRWSVCSIGLAIVESGEITNRFYTLVNPMTQYFVNRFVDIHGITFKDTLKSPSFDEVWPEVDTLIGESPIVAHNVSFERSCINACGDEFGTKTDYEFIDTLSLARRAFPTLANHKLPTVAESCGYKLSNHHDALADATACAYILKEFWTKPNLRTFLLG